MNSFLSFGFAMHGKYLSLFQCLLLGLLLAGCASKPPAYQGLAFPPTNSAAVAFQEKDVPAQCKAFAHIIVTTPAGVSGARIGQGIADFAKAKGADLILAGQSRKIKGSGSHDFQFISYGPKQEYLFSKGWLGWKFGLDDWEKNGGITGFGYNNWSDSALYDFSQSIQIVLLRCEPDRP
jgi:hypothetical protein